MVELVEYAVADPTERRAYAMGAECQEDSLLAGASTGTIPAPQQILA